MNDVLRMTQTTARQRAKEVTRKDCLVVAMPAREMASGTIRAGGWGTPDDFWTLVRVDANGRILGAYRSNESSEDRPYLGPAPTCGRWIMGHE